MNRRPRPRPRHRISSREIALLSGCEQTEVKRWIYRLYPEVFCPSRKAASPEYEEGVVPAYITWEQAREVLAKLAMSQKNEQILKQILVLDAFLAREGRQ
jgi:transcription initiation factor IIE alpha subunit